MGGRLLMVAVLFGAGAATADEIASSSCQVEYSPAGAMDGDRFKSQAGVAWRGLVDAVDGWWWQVKFAEPRQIGSIQQIHGEAGELLTNSPQSYVWQYSDDGIVWRDLRETAIANETRLFRIHRLKRRVEVRYLRLHIATAQGPYPTLREVEFYPETDSPIAFPEWILSVNITDRVASLDGFGHVRVARRTDTGKEVLAQHIDVPHVTPEFVTVEPRPLCMFLSGSYKDWCEVDRVVYRGIEQILRQRLLPIWGSCGGCQLLAILEEAGVDQEWDCPHCRDPQRPRLPIYTHIHCEHPTNAPTACGSYAACEFERGPLLLQRVQDDPVLACLPANGQFTCQESHCGQIAYLPKGWTLLATHALNGRTVNQLMRVEGYPIYAAQFHIDMGGEHAEILAANFLNVARQWQCRNQRK